MLMGIFNIFHHTGRTEQGIDLIRIQSSVPIGGPCEAIFELNKVKRSYGTGF